MKHLVKIVQESFYMGYFGTITAFLLSSSLDQLEGSCSFVQSRDLILSQKYENRLSLFDRLYPLKPKNPI